MEKNDDIRTVHSPTKRLSKKLLIVYGLAVVVLVACATYATVTIVNKNADKDKKPVASKPKLVAPSKVAASLESADKASKAAYDQHAATKAAFDEQSVRLVK